MSWTAGINRAELSSGTKGSTLSIIRRVVMLFSSYKLQIGILVPLIAISAALELFPALLIGKLVDEPLSGNFDSSQTLRLGLAIGGMYIASALVTAIVTYINAKVTNGIMFDLRERMHGHVQRLSPRFFTKTRTGEILSRVSNDVMQVEGAMSGSFTDLVSSLMLISAALVLMFFLDWRLTAAALGIILVWAVPMMLVGRYMRGVQRQLSEELATLNSHLAETMSVSGAQLVRAFGRQDFEAERFEGVSERLRSLAIRRRMASGLFSIATRLSGALAIGFVYYIGTRWVASSTLTIGAVVTFAVLIQRLFAPMAVMARANTALIAALALFERIFEYLDMPVDLDNKPGALDLENPKGQVAFEGVSFSYEDSDTPALTDVAFEAKPGQMVALVGPSGAGKTSLAYLLQRFYDPDEGRVLIDGHDLRDLSISSISAAVGTVMQDPTLFHSSLADNIRYGRLDATDEEIRDAANIAALGELIESLPDGLDTIVGERGFRLSGGEKQRVAIARVVLKDPAILILDEATSSLDSRLEREIREATEKLSANRTTIVIAHRLSTVVAADRILVLSDGRIVEDGTHAELLAGGNLYAALYRQQFATAEPVQTAI